MDSGEGVDVAEDVGAVGEVVEGDRGGWGEEEGGGELGEGGDYLPRGVGG